MPLLIAVSCSRPPTRRWPHAATTAAAAVRQSLDLTIGDLVPLTGDLADFGPPGRKAADLAVEEIKAGDQEAGVGPHGQDRARGQPDRPAGRRAGGPQAGRRGRDCIAGAWASARHDPGRAVGRDPRGDPADLAVVDRRRDHRPRGRRPAEPHRAAGPLPGPGAGRRRSRRRSAARRARRSTSAPATTPTAPASPTRSARRGRRRAARSASG